MVFKKEINGTQYQMEYSALSGKVQMYVDGTPLVKLNKKMFQGTDKEGNPFNYVVHVNSFSSFTVLTPDGIVTMLEKPSPLDMFAYIVPLIAIMACTIAFGIFAGLVTLAVAAIGLTVIMSVRINPNISKPIKVVVNIVIILIVLATLAPGYFISLALSNAIL